MDDDDLDFEPESFWLFLFSAALVFCIVLAVVKACGT